MKEEGEIEKRKKLWAMLVSEFRKFPWRVDLEFDASPKVFYLGQSL
jgi:hypothetical protein